MPRRQPLRGKVIVHRDPLTAELAAELGQQGAAREAMARRRAEHYSAGELVRRAERLPAGCMLRRVYERALTLHLEAETLR